MDGVPKQAMRIESDESTEPIYSVKLRIVKPPMWWLWRGFISLPRDWTGNNSPGDRIDNANLRSDNQNVFFWQYHFDDTMDMPVFEEETSFPSVKPNIDLYGIPRRSRSQRGWYHVHRPPCQLCSASRSVNATTPAISAAWHVPPELLHKIAESCPDARETRQSLMSLALVCRDWAPICLGYTVHCIQRCDRPHGRADIMSLQALISAPGSYLKQSITNFGDMAHCLDGRADPWFHLLLHTRRQLPHFKHPFIRETLSETGPLGGGLRTMRSIHAHLPRELPRSFSHDIYHLTLEDIRFQDFDHLKRVVGELPNLRKLFGTRLSWASDCFPPRRKYYARIVESNMYFRLQQCPDDVVSSIRLAIPLPSPSSGGDWTCLHAVLHSLALDGLQKPIEVRTRKQVLRQHRGTSLPAAQCTTYTIPLQGVNSNIRGQTCRLELVVPVLLSGAVFVPNTVKLYIYFHRPEPSLVISEAFVWINWEVLDDAVEAHHQIQGIHFTTGTTLRIREQNSERFEKVPLHEDEQRYLVANLPKAAAAGKVLFD